MKHFKATVAVLGMAFLVTACHKDKNPSAAQPNEMNAVPPETNTPVANAPAENDNAENATDTGPRG